MKNSFLCFIFFINILCGTLLIVNTISYSKKFFVVNLYRSLAFIFNTLIGYCNIGCFISIYAFMSNQPKGSGYSVPDSEAGFNMLLGLILLGVYLLITIPPNYFFYKKSKVSLKKYLLFSALAMCLGMLFFWIFLDKSKRLF